MSIVSPLDRLETAQVVRIAVFMIDALGKNLPPEVAIQGGF
jgi:hypothetical protein